MCALGCMSHDYRTFHCAFSSSQVISPFLKFMCAPAPRTRGNRAFCRQVIPSTKRRFPTLNWAGPYLRQSFPSGTCIRDRRLLTLPKGTAFPLLRQFQILSFFRLLVSAFPAFAEPFTERFHKKQPLSISLPSANERWSAAQRLLHLTDQGKALSQSYSVFTGLVVCRSCSMGKTKDIASVGTSVLLIVILTSKSQHHHQNHEPVLHSKEHLSYLMCILSLICANKTCIVSP